MEIDNLQVSTRINNSTSFKHESNVVNTIVFLNQESDKITICSGSENIEICVYDNYQLLFIGTKHDLFEILKSHNNGKSI